MTRNKKKKVRFRFRQYQRGKHFYWDLDEYDFQLEESEVTDLTIVNLDVNFDLLDFGSISGSTKFNKAWLLHVDVRPILDFTFSDGDASTGSITLADQAELFDLSVPFDALNSLQVVGYSQPTYWSADAAAADSNGRMMNLWRGSIFRLFQALCKPSLVPERLPTVSAGIQPGTTGKLLTVINRLGEDPSSLSTNDYISGIMMAERLRPSLVIDSKLRPLSYLWLIFGESSTPTNYGDSGYTDALFQDAADGPATTFANMVHDTNISGTDELVRPAMVYTGSGQTDAASAGRPYGQITKQGNSSNPRVWNPAVAYQDVLAKSANALA